MKGRFYGIGCGPGDPELMTVKAVRLLAEASIVAYPCAKAEGGVARGIAKTYLRPDQTLIPLVYPVTAGPGADAPGYPALMRRFYDETAAQLAAHLDGGATVAILCEGDPFFFGSFIYWHKRLSPHYDSIVVPGVSSILAAPVAMDRPLCIRTDTVTVMPATMSEDALTDRLLRTDAAVIMKLGRTFAKVRRALVRAGRLDDAVYVERASWADQRVLPAAGIDPATVPYFSVVVVPGSTPD
ncbi:MAG: precorrin-2 C(20)-methyltransferase [Alphaproteobacteria bacterium]|jgi:precorrin-2 C(20)-methyltransferase|nr:precorrin-2 C(20)-methyltransferase [Alphaproteobacteria bacterium]